VTTLITDTECELSQNMENHEFLRIRDFQFSIALNVSCSYICVVHW